MKCQICKEETEFEEYDTAKHKWYVCKYCTNAFSLPKKDVSYTQEFYDYFINFGHIKKQSYVFQNFMLEMEDIFEVDGFNFQDKKILDISGGNGHFVKKFEKFGARAYLTEINETVVKYAKNRLKIPAIVFDLNDKKNKLFEEEFDVILLRSCIMFCEDLSLLLKNLISRCHDKTLVVFYDCIPPLIKKMYQFENDDYIYRFFYDKEYLYKSFEENGFDVIQHDYRNALDKSVHYVLKVKKNG
ncbi:methyltransferase domain-containing protein [Arcobacter arenosus]|uniref:methyltransferase domain-containing protein n=1 Tax=Arcobacter arenosus TaxID=2576037 RepID=UPI003BAC120A